MVLEAEASSIRFSSRVSCSSGVEVVVVVGDAQAGSAEHLAAADAPEALLAEALSSRSRRRLSDW
jgi:hypothetical protein